MTDLGADLRDGGSETARIAEECENPGWSMRAYLALAGLAREKPELHTDDLTKAFVEPPHHYNAWGAIWLQAIRDGIIERTGAYRASADPKKHAHVYPIYRSRMYI